MPLGRVGVTLGDQALDHRDHLRHMRGAARLDIGRQRAERGHVLVVLRGRATGQLLDRLAIVAGGIDDLVVDIGDVAHITHMFRAVGVAQQPVKLVEHDRGATVADMGEIVDGRAADIHPHALGIERLEGLLAAGQRVVEDERHRAMFDRST